MALLALLAHNNVHLCITLILMDVFRYQIEVKEEKTSKSFIIDSIYSNNKISFTNITGFPRQLINSVQLNCSAQDKASAFLNCWPDLLRLAN